MSEIALAKLVPALTVSAVFVWLTLRRRMLRLNGALAAASMGLWVLFWAGWPWLLPLFFFFLSSVFIGKWNKKRLGAADSKQGRPRDFWQVWCNGGVYAVLATGAAGPSAEWALPLMVLSLAVSTADTWASEIGQYFRQTTWDVLRWQQVPVGLSGGVSWAGTLAGLAGAAAMALLGTALLPAPTLTQTGWIALGGFTGMVIDSLLGAGLQARYRDATSNALSDQSGPDSRRISGYRWMNNDAVNWWSNVLTVLLNFPLLAWCD